ncbi:MAG: AAA family ATPase [Roseiflexaceae bacterium]|nr:AAA family ATPase [Roseiflexaceae bacterium]
MLRSGTPSVASPIDRSTIQVMLLGTPELAFDNQPIQLARRQLRALLYRLAGTKQAVPRDQLCFLLWPDQPEVVVRRQLSVLLTHLRRALPWPEAVLILDDAVGLAADRVWCDTIVFEQSLSAVRKQRIDQLQALAKLYRGPFLDGFSLPTHAEYESWVLQERESKERQYLNVLMTITDISQSQGDYPSAISAAQQYLAVDELAEDMHRRLIWLYSSSGDRTAALRQFERCVLVLERELGVCPLAETRKIYEDARDGTLDQAEPTSRPTYTADRPQQSSRTLPFVLPSPPSAIIGREEHVLAILALLRQNAVHLLTLTGPGGSGKTRLAIEVAAHLRKQFDEQVVFVALAPIRNPDSIAEAIAQACAIPQVPNTTALRRLQDYLSEKQLLLVLDNFEHLLAGSTVVSELLAAVPGLQILVTSRSVLHLSGEHVFLVPPLPVPDLAELPPIEVLATQPSIALLLARVRARNPGFQLTSANAADLAHLCSQLDGLPLALELAAAHLRLLSPSALRKRFTQRLPMLTQGPRDLPARHQTLRATIDWSYQLLNRDEQLFFEHLALFAGGWTLEAAEDITLILRDVYGANAQAIQLTSSSAAILAALVDRSLVQMAVDSQGECRFSMLETLREYGIECLQRRGSYASAARAHAEYYCGFAEEAMQKLRGPDIFSWLPRVDAEHANILIALDWSLADQHNHVAVRLVAAMGRYWISRQHMHELESWVTRLLERYPSEANPAMPYASALAGAYFIAADVALLAGDVARANRYVHSSQAHWRALGDQIGVTRSLLFAASILFDAGAFDAAEAALAEGEAMANAIGFKRGMAAALTARARQALLEGRIAEAKPLYEQALHSYRQDGDLPPQTDILPALATVALAEGDITQATTYANEGLAIARAGLIQPEIALALEQLGEIARVENDYERAAAWYQESLDLLKGIGALHETARLLHDLAYIALSRGEKTAAAALFMQSFDRLGSSLLIRGTIEVLVGLGCVAATDSNPMFATRLWAAAEIAGQKHRVGLWPADRRELARYQALCQASCAPDTLTSVWQAGSTLSLEAAIAEARAAFAARPFQALPMLPC